MTLMRTALLRFAAQLLAPALSAPTQEGHLLDLRKAMNTGFEAVREGRNPQHMTGSFSRRRQ